jgi:hypothetical protein
MLGLLKRKTSYKRRRSTTPERSAISSSSSRNSVRTELEVPGINWPCCSRGQAGAMA